jgi:metal-responsive CopG/Arc/MetJ family transcriptional regulator
MTDKPQTTPEKLQVTFSYEAEKAVDEIMRLRACRSRQEAIRRALGTELAIQQYRRRGWAVLIRKGHKYIELEWPDV